MQAASELAWRDEAHVIANRDEYRRKFAAVRAAAPGIAPPAEPDGGFYWWIRTPIDDQAFARRLFEDEHITVLPGSYLGRPGADGANPGSQHIRVAWVAPLDECIEAAGRLQRFVTNL